MIRKSTTSQKADSISQWDAVLAYMDVEEQQRVEATRRFQDAMYRRGEIMREISAKEYVVKKIPGRGDTFFVLEHQFDKFKNIEVQAIKTAGTSVLWQGLPDELRLKMQEIAVEQQLRNAFICLQAVVMSFSQDAAVAGLGSMVALDSNNFRETSEIESDLSAEIESILNKDDPKRYYQI